MEERPIALWVCPVSNLAGVARHILDVARVEVPGWRQVFTVPEGPLLERLRDLGCAVIPLEIDGPVHQVVRDLRRTVVRIRPAVVHSHLAKADFLTTMATAGLSTTLISTEHHIAQDPLVLHGTRYRALSRQVAHHTRIRRFARLIAVSESTARDMRKYWRPSAPITVIHNGVDRLDPQPQRTAGLRVLSLTRLAPEKNLETTLEVFARIRALRPDARLTIAGTGPAEPALRSMARRLGLDDVVTFPGFVDATTALTEHDVLIQPSKADNFSYTLLDAVNHGLGVVASAVGGNGEILPPRCVLALDDVEGMAAAVVTQGMAVDQRPKLPDNVPTVSEMADHIAEVYTAAGAGAVPQIRLTPRGKRMAMTNTLTIASNQGAIGGGEVMLLAIAEAARNLGRDVQVVGPAAPADLVTAARHRGFKTTALPSGNPAAYLRQLRIWDRQHREGLLWCNGLRPALATAGHGRRVVHLHQRPSRQLTPLSVIARRGATLSVAPSKTMADHIPGATMMWNWTAQVEATRCQRALGEPFTVGFLGRLSPDKGIIVLCAALRKLLDESPDDFRLLVAGDSRFVSAKDKGRVQEAIASLGAGADHVGWLSRDSFFSSVDLAIFPSCWDEPFGLVAAEAMSARCPFIISDAGALPEVAGHDYRWTSPAGDAKQLAEMIQEAASNDWTEDLVASHRRWFTEFSPAAGRERLKDLLCQVDELEGQPA